MLWIRYILYFMAVVCVTWMLTQLEIAFPGSLKLDVIVSQNDYLDSSEFSPIEIIQLLIIAICGLLMAWVAKYCPSQRPIAFPFGGFALVFFFRELDYYFDRFLIDNLWQVLVTVAGAFVITYAYRQRKRMKIAWGRIWPSPGIALLFAGTVIVFVFVRLVGDDLLWLSILGDNYQRVVAKSVAEFFELSGYFLWLLGSIEYTYQARAMAYREPRPVAQRLRKKRRHDAEGEF